MSLLTKIYNLKAKYRETSGAINTERAALQNIMTNRAKSVREQQSIQKRFTSASRDFVSSYGTQSDIDSFDPQNVDFTNVRDAFYDRQMDQFKQTSGYRDYMNYRRIIASGGAGSMMSAIYERAKPGIADFDRLIAKPMETLNTTFGNIESISGELKSNYETITSFDSDISASQQRLKGFGASQQEIQSMISETQRAYGMSTEQRKRGTRGNVQRRTALTSRSSFA